MVLMWNKEMISLDILSFFPDGNAVAFTAILSRDTTVGGKEVVKYDRVLTNVGGAYKSSTGIFTAPYKGIYTISCSLLSSTSNSVHLDITKNGKKNIHNLRCIWNISSLRANSATASQ